MSSYEEDLEEKVHALEAEIQTLRGALEFLHFNVSMSNIQKQEDDSYIVNINCRHIIDQDAPYYQLIKFYSEKSPKKK